MRITKNAVKGDTIIHRVRINQILNDSMLTRIEEIFNIAIGMENQTHVETVVDNIPTKQSAQSKVKPAKHAKRLAISPVFAALIHQSRSL